MTGPVKRNIDEDRISFPADEYLLGWDPEKRMVLSLKAAGRDEVALFMDQAETLELIDRILFEARQAGWLA